MWQAKGYKVSVWRDPEKPILADICHTAPYPGHSMACNEMVRLALAVDPEAQWVVVPGDDIDPDPKHDPEDIVRECTEHFGGTFGVMQPTGDRWLNAGIEHICGSPWIGREFCEKINRGRGPFWPEYFHMWNDSEMQEVSKRLKILWQRPDLVHLHRHWMRETPGNPPAFLERANSRENWDAMREIFMRRKERGFPGHEPLP